MKLVQSEDVSREIIQECFLKVWLHRDKLPDIEKPVHWIYRIASNECFTWLNKEALRHKKTSILEHNEKGTNSPSVLDEVHANETRRLIQDAIAAMPEQKRAIYLMSRNEGLKSEEIASRLKLSHSHVRNSISTALTMIRKHLEQSNNYDFLLILLPFVIFGLGCICF